MPRGSRARRTRLGPPPRCGRGWRRRCVCAAACSSSCSPPERPPYCGPCPPEGFSYQSVGFRVPCPSRPRVSPSHRCERTLHDRAVTGCDRRGRRNDRHPDAGHHPVEDAAGLHREPRRRELRRLSGAAHAGHGVDGVQDPAHLDGCRRRDRQPRAGPGRRCAVRPRREPPRRTPLRSDDVALGHAAAVDPRRGDRRRDTGRGRRRRAAPAGAVRAARLDVRELLPRRVARLPGRGRRPRRRGRGRGADRRRRVPRPSRDPHAAGRAGRDGDGQLGCELRRAARRALGSGRRPRTAPLRPAAVDGR
ncbi:hypothetical protein FF38_08651, partial [Lucilia cuprina]